MMTAYEQPYTPINCDFYDELEIAAIRRTPVEIVLQGSNGAKERITTRILNLVVRNGAEYLVHEQGEDVRLDRIIAVGDKFLKNYC
jgi:Rho-binding antiterminator